MSLRDDPRYFPQPDVPTSGDYSGSFGREQLYYGYAPRSVIPEVAGEKTATNGKYTFDSATGQYTWVPAGSTIKADTAADYKSGLGGVGGEGGQDFGGMQTSTPDWDTTNTIGNMMSNYGLPSIGGYLQQAAKEGQADARMDVNTQTGAYSQDAQNQRAAEAAAMAGGGVDFSDADSSGTGFAGDVFASGGLTAFASGGLGSLGGYSDGGRLLRGPGDGVSDSIPATIGKAKQPARLADNEFVIPARIVSELGNGSSEAGARKLYAMLARIQAGRKKSIGKNKVAVDSKAYKHLPA